MKIIIKIIPFVFLAQLIGCASNQVEQNKYPTTGASDGQIILADESMQRASERIEQFHNSDVNKILIPYVVLANKLNNIENEADACIPENIKLYQDMYSLNNSSLMASSLLFLCEVGDAKEQSIYFDNYQSTIRVLLNQKNGSSLANLVNVREFSEAEFILSSAGYTVLDQEIIENGDQFAYRIHAVDGETGEFEYHYYTNFEFLKRIYSSFNIDIKDTNVTAITLKAFLESKNQAAANYVTNNLLKEKKYKEIIDFLEKNEELPPISRLNLARAYLYLELDDKLDALIDDIVTQKELGDINASVFIAELLIKLNGKEVSKNDIEPLLKEVDQRTIIGNGAYLLSEMYYSLENFYEFGYWSKKAVEQNTERFYSKIYNMLRSDNNYFELRKYLEKQHRLGNLQATYNLANVYSNGLGVEVDLEKETELYSYAAKRGHEASMYELAQNLWEGKGVALNVEMALHWFKLAAEKGNNNALNEIGSIYYRGAKNIELNYAESMKWYKKASDRGIAISTDNLGLFYQHGLSVPVDNDKAIKYYKQAAEKGNLRSFERLGDIYQYTLGKQYYREAAKWYLRGGIKGHVRSQYEYALINARYLDNEQLSLEWFEKILRSNDDEAMTWTALNFEEGEKYLHKDISKTIEFYNRAAELGNPQAQANLGFLYESGKGLEKNLSKARSLYEKSAAQNEAQGLNNLATFYKEGIAGLKIDLKKAFEMYSKASFLGNKFSHNNLGEMYFYGEGVVEDNDKAFKYFKLAEKEKFTSSYYYLGYLHLNGLTTKKDFAQAKKYFELSVDSGNSNAADNLAVMYSLGLGVEKNQTKAISLFEKAAKLSQSHSNMNIYIANKYHFGTYGIDVNYKIAHEYYEKSVKNNNATAMNNLAELYRWGHGVEIDYQKAIALYMKAIAMDKGIAMFNMAELYRDGHGVTTNEKTSFDWMKKSTDKGFLEAYVGLSDFYKSGFGTVRDQKKSIKWLEKGVDEGYYLAQYKLAIAFYLGESVEKNIEKANNLMQLSADNGYQKAIDVIENGFGEI